MTRSLPPSVVVFSSLVALTGPVDEATANHKVYRKVAPSTVAFAGRNGAAIGAGAIIDVEKRLVITAYHVINGSAGPDMRIRVFFPIQQKDRIVTDAYIYAQAYRKNSAGLIVQGKVIDFDPITIYGDGKEDIDLTVLDPQGNEVGRSDTYESRETVAWTPGQAGLHIIQVKNLGGGGKHSRYFLMTD